MLLTLKNFKCWKESTFDLSISNNNIGITLISGKSGVGKTSIIEAIVFVLFGSGRKITKIGEKSCNVKLLTSWRSNNLTSDQTNNTNNIEITRQKGPNRLTLIMNGIMYEDDSAQALIDNEYTDTFNSIGYLSQSSINSFVLMGPQDKLAFLEKLIFKNMDMKTIKSKISLLVRERNTNLQQTTGKIDMLTQMLQSETENITQPEYPFDCSENNRDTFEKNLSTQQSNLNKKLKSVISKLDRLKTMQKETTEYETNNKSLLNEQQFNDAKLKEPNQYNIDFSNSSHVIQKIDEINQSINSIQSHINFLSKYSEYNEKIILVKSLENKFQKSFQTEKSQIQQNITRIKTLILTPETINELQQDIEIFKEYIQDIKIYNKLDKELDSISKDTMNIFNKASEVKITLTESYRQELSDKIETNLQKITKQKMYKKKYKCPECKTKLSICSDTDKLIPVPEDMSKDNDIDKLNQKITKYRKNLQIFDDLFPKLSIMISKKSDIQLQRDNISSKYEDFDYSQDYINQLSNDISNNKKSIDSHNKSSDELLSFNNKLQDPFLNNHIIKNMHNDIEKTNLSIESLKSIIDTEKLALRDSDFINNLESMEPTTFQKFQDDKKHELHTFATTLKMFNQEHKNYLNLVEKKQSIAEKLESLITNRQQELTKNSKKPLSLKSIIKHIENNLTEQESINQMITQNQQDTISLQKWKIKNQNYLDYISKQEELENLHKSASGFSEKLKSIYRIKDIIMKAETLAINHIINQINETVARYLDIFFPDNTITVLLHCPDTDEPNPTTKQTTDSTESKKISKTTKKPSPKEKTQITMSVDYKDMEADISILSGGELQRIVIAYNLALSELFNLPLILLDECTSNLDQELTEIVVKGIHHNCKDKMIIMIAHQVVSGIFDKVVSI